MMIDVKLTIVNSKPEIYRVIRVSEGLNLLLFHEVIQVAFDWTNSNSHFFKLGDMIVKRNEEELNLGQTIEKYNPFLYVYDLADFWTISIALLSRNDMVERIPECLEGQGKSPPEDSGGIVNYSEVLEILKRHKDGDRKFPLIIDWIGEDFDPNEFDMQRINENFKNLVL